MSNTQAETLRAAPAARPEAAAWVARLQGPQLDERIEQLFRHWLGSHPAHRSAFDEAATVWSSLEVAGKAYRRARRQRQFATLAAAVVMASALTLFIERAAPPEQLYATRIGEQQTLALDDGSRITLNTNSRLLVQYDRERREATLLEGEALFDIAHDPAKPFVVHVDGREVRALGTSFVVYKTEDAFAVTLFEGKVSVGPHLEAGQLPDPQIVVLEPGQQWSMGRHSVRQLTPLQLEAATQWRRQEVIFNDTPLQEAVAEMNRYTDRPLVVSAADVAGRTVSGVFHIGDTESFVRTIHALYGVDITRDATVIPQP